jgi:hypothetical protein
LHQLVATSATGREPAQKEPTKGPDFHRTAIIARGTHGHLAKSLPVLRHAPLSRLWVALGHASPDVRPQDLPPSLPHSFSLSLSPSPSLSLSLSPFTATHSGVQHRQQSLHHSAFWAIVFYSGVCEIKYHPENLFLHSVAPFPQSVKVELRSCHVVGYRDGTFFRSGPSGAKFNFNFDCLGGGGGNSKELIFEMVLYFTNTGIENDGPEIGMVWTQLPALHT